MMLVGGRCSGGYADEHGQQPKHILGQSRKSHIYSSLTFDR